MATTFVGRHAELTEALRLVRRARLVTISGTGGVGKTHLARRVLEEARGIPVGLTVMVDLEPLDDPAALPAAIARALGVAGHPDRTPAEWTAELCAWFGRRDVLLVLDTCDRLVDAVAGLAAELLRAASNLRVLATCRQSLGVPGEHVHLVPPMPVEDAVELLRDRLGHPDGLDAGQAARLCRLLDGIPLAVELAARRLAVRPIAELAAELDAGWDLPDLPEPPPGTPDRHRSLRAALDWSHGLCSPRERLLWARMSVFPADFDLRAAEHVCAGGALPAHAVLDAVAGLVDKSLLLRRDHPDGTRYHVLRGVRGLGAEWLDRLGEQEEIHRRHDEYRRWHSGQE